MQTYDIQIRVDANYQQVECSGNTPCLLADQIRYLVKDYFKEEAPESICSRCIFRNKTDDCCEYPYGGRNCHINENGVYECNGFEEVEKQEQPESARKEEMI